MLCFPQVLFAGAMVPVDVMSNRWAFEAIGRILDLEGRFDVGQLGAWEPALQGTPSVQIAALSAMVVCCAVGVVVALSRRLTPR